MPKELTFGAKSKKQNEEGEEEEEEEEEEKEQQQQQQQQQQGVFVAYIFVEQPEEASKYNITLLPSVNTLIARGVFVVPSTLITHSLQS